MIYKTISPTESQVGKYVDINGDGIPKGIIFADKIDFEHNTTGAASFDYIYPVRLAITY